MVMSMSAFAGMTEEGLRADAVRTIIPATAGMTAIGQCRHSRPGGNPCILRNPDSVYPPTEHQYRTLRGGAALRGRRRVIR